MKNKIRIYQLASDLGLQSKVVIELANKLNININSSLATINNADKISIINNLKKHSKIALKNKITIPINIKEKALLKEKDNTVYKQKKITSDISKKIKELFIQIKIIDDLVGLINGVNKYIYGKESHNNFQKKQFTYYAFHSKDKYTIFDIPKKSGGTREIYAPKKGLKNLLNILNIVFQSVYKNHMVSHGFIKNRSVVTNAKCHTSKNYVYNIDLKNFFPSIHQARIWKRLQYPPFNLPQDVVNLIAGLVCYQYKTADGKTDFLPQGAPTSPVLSNIICERLDRKLFKLAKENNVKYTRYADDMTFSSDHNIYQGKSDFLKKIKKIIKEENFKINKKKTRLQKRGYRQEVTGLIVNDKVNVSRKYIKNLRTLIYLVNRYGEEKAQKIFNKNYKAKEKNTPSIRLVIHGKIEYLKMVKGFEDSTYKTLVDKFNIAFKVEKPKDEKIDNAIPEDKVYSQSCEHNPKELVKLLSVFTQNNNPLKYTTHSWEEGKFESYEEFIKQIKVEWRKINKDLKKYSKNLHAKINSFLFNTNLGGKNKKGYIEAWGENKVKFGWSSPDLKEWCASGAIPFEYRLKDGASLKVGTDIETFYDLCMKVFKHEIEIKTDNNRLKNLFLDIADKQLGFDFKVVDKNLEGKDFYTDVQWLKSALNKIFEEIKKRTTHPDIIISAADEDNVLEIKIIQIGAVPNKTSEQLIDRKDKGSFGSIATELCSLCDWSIEAKCDDGNYKINYLKSSEVASFENINKEPKGFTHILRFYK